MLFEDLPIFFDRSYISETFNIVIFLGVYFSGVRDNSGSQLRYDFRFYLRGSHGEFQTMHIVLTVFEVGPFEVV